MSCAICENDLSKFHKTYLENKDSDYRKNLINQLVLDKKCKCYQRVLH